MSHALVVVMAGSQSHAEMLLAPYDDRLSVDLHTRRCFCIGSKAERETREYSDREFGTTAAMWARCVSANPDADKVTLQTIWKEKFLPERKHAEYLFFMAHPDRNNTEPNCPECNGKGMYDTTANPLGEYDYYTYGAGWADWLLPLEPSEVGTTLGNATFSLPYSILTPMSGWRNIPQTWKYDNDLSSFEAEHLWSEEYWKFFNEAAGIGLSPYIFNYHC